MIPKPATVVPAPGVVALDPERVVRSLDGDASLGDEGYLLVVSEDGIVLRAHRPAGLFYGEQTLRQLGEPGESIGAVRIVDQPRFEWRGVMLDVARHFFGVADVKRLIDLIALYKLNRLHLHLTDDQGWRIAIASWARLAEIGGSTAIGGGTGGYYTQEQYAEIVEYAESRHVTVVPEIDMPGHTQAALASYPELTCDGVAAPVYTGDDVGFSSLCIRKDETYAFVDDVVGELAALTPGPYFHIGGDEALATEPAEYALFMRRAEEIVQTYGKRPIAWEEVAPTELLPGTIVQHWQLSELALRAVQHGAQMIMSPGSHAYLDMKYDESTELGQDWAGLIEVRDAYVWDPATQVPGVTEAEVLGIEAALWSETLAKMADVEFMAFPRLLGLAEVGWSPQSERNWDDYRSRLAAHEPTLRALGVNFYRSPQIPWERD